MHQLYLIMILPALIFGGIYEEIVNIAAEETLFDQILYNEQSKIYLLRNVKQNARYEVRVSYPAVIPTEFLIEVEAYGETSASFSRKLLNVEQLQFNSKDVVNYKIKVTAFRTGVPLNKERLDDPVLFNIIINQLYLGLSFETWKMVTVLIITILLVLKFGVPIVIWYMENELLKGYDKYAE